MVTKLLHISDTHLGKNQYSSNVRKNDFSRSFDVTIDIALEEQVDAVIHTGDLFDDRTPNTEEVSSAFSSIKRLDDNDICFLGIVGNHERKWENQWLDIFETLDNVHRLGRNPFVVNEEVSIYGFDSIRDSEWEDENFQLESPYEDTVVCVCMHELFVELISPTKADRSVEHVIEKMNIEPDIMPLGDYHASVDEKVLDVPVFYSGATERTSVTQRSPTIRTIRINDKDVESYKWRKIEGIRENVPRPFFSVNVDLDESSTGRKIRRRIQEDVPKSKIQDAVVVVTLEGNSNSPATSSDAYAILENLSVKVPYVRDKRRPEVLDFDSEDATDPTSIDINDMINEELDDDISEKVVDVEEQIVRDLTISKSNIRDIVKSKFRKGDKK